MELIYAAMLLHKAGKPIDEHNLKKVISAVGINKDDTQIKALVAALDGVDIDKVIKEAAIPIAAPAHAGEHKAEKKEEKKEEKVDDSKAVVGLGALFG